MPTLGLNVNATISTNKTRQSIDNFYRGISVEEVQLHPYAFLSLMGKKEYEVKNASFILFIGDVYDGSNPFDLTVYTNGNHSHLKIEDTEASEEDKKENQYISGALGDTIGGAYDPDFDDEDTEEEEKPSSVPSTPLIPVTPIIKTTSFHNVNFLMLNASNIVKLEIKSLVDAQVGYKLVIG